jgi:hypothetical protein
VLHELCAGAATQYMRCTPSTTVQQVAANLGQEGYLADIAKATDDIPIQVSVAAQQLGTCTYPSAGAVLWMNGWMCIVLSLAKQGAMREARPPCPRIPPALQIVFCNAGYMLTGFFFSR